MPSNLILLPFNSSRSRTTLFMVFYIAALFSLSCSYITTHGRSHNAKKQSFESPDSSRVNDYEEVLAAMQNELFLNSPMKDVSKSSPCMEITDKNATMVKSIGRSTKTLVDVDPERKFEIAYCSSEGENFCAVDSTCATIYRWKKAPIRQELFDGSGFQFLFNDEILVPQGCTCVINSFKSGLKSNLPIIIF